MAEGVKPRRPTRKRKVVRVEVTRLEMLMDGTLSFDDLDDEEIFRMQLRDKNGHFTGRPTKWIPTELAQQWVEEQRKRAVSWFHQQLPEAQKALLSLVTARHLTPGDATKLRAAEMIFERVIGKVGAEMHLTVDKGKSFEDFVGDAIIDLEVVPEATKELEQ